MKERERERDKCMRNPGLNHGPERLLQWDNWQNMNKVYRLVTNIVSVLIYYLSML